MGLARSHVRELLGRGDDWTDGRTHRTLKGDASLLFQWRKLERQGALTAVSAGEAVVPASELAAARAEIAKLQRVLGKKTLENEILKEAVEYAAEKKWIARSPLLPGEDQ